MEEHKNTQYRRPDETISLDELKSFLWGAATRLRGQIDAAGYKEYIFPLLFFKRISDVYDEQFEGFVAEGGEEYAGMQAAELAIRIPDGAHWRDVREVTENVGQRLAEAFIAIEQANPGEEADGRVIGGLDGIFGPKDGWTNKNKMPDHIITSLIEDFSRYNLGLSSCPADEMGQAYEYLVGKFADDAGNTAQEFYTNRTVVHLMTEMLKPEPGESIYDPTCGSAGMLISAIAYLKAQGKEWRNVAVYGQEINALTSAIGRMNLFLHGVKDFTIVNDDTLKNPAFIQNGQLQTFDLVLANPPYSISQWDRAAFESDKYGRNFLGVPTQRRADFAFVAHILKSLNENSGRCAILLPNGILNRYEESGMRIEMIKHDYVECVIGLGKNLFYNSPMEACILICRTKKTGKRIGNVLFINAVKLIHREGTYSFLSEDDIHAIADAYHDFCDKEGVSKTATIGEVLKNEGSLRVSRYVQNTSSDDSEDYTDEDVINNWLEVSAQTHRSIDDVISLLNEGDRNDS